MTTTPAAEVRRRGATTQNELAAARAEVEVRMEFLGTGAHPYAEEEVPVRASLRELAKRLRALSERSGGELAAAAREVWLNSLLPMHDPANLIRALAHVEAVCQFVDNWTDCARSQVEHDVFFDDFVNPARVAASEALQALCALVDLLQARAPEQLR